MDIRAVFVNSGGIGSIINRRRYITLTIITVIVILAVVIIIWKDRERDAVLGDRLI